MIIFTFIRIFLLIFFSLHLLSCAGDRRMSLISSIAPFVERNDIIYTYTIPNSPNSFSPLVLPDCPPVSASGSVKRFDCKPIDTNKPQPDPDKPEPKPKPPPAPQPDPDKSEPKPPRYQPDPDNPDNPMPPRYQPDPDNPDPQIVLDDAVCRLDKNGRPLSGSLNQILCSRTPDPDKPEPKPKPPPAPQPDPDKPEPKPPAPQPDPDKPEPKPPAPQPDPVSEDAVCRLDKNGKPLSGLLNQILCSRTSEPEPKPKPPALQPDPPAPAPQPDPPAPAPQPDPPISFKYCEDFFDSSTGFDWSKLFSDEFSTCVWKSKPD